MKRQRVVRHLHWTFARETVEHAHAIGDRDHEHLPFRLGRRVRSWAETADRTRYPHHIELREVTSFSTT